MYLNQIFKRLPLRSAPRNEILIDDGGSGRPQNRYNIAAIITNGTLDVWHPIANNQIYFITVSVGRVHLGGAFSVIGGTPSPNYAAVAQ